MHIMIDSELMNEALHFTELKDAKEVVEFSLKEFIDHRRNDALAKAFGQMTWEGDLAAAATSDMKCDDIVAYTTTLVTENEFSSDENLLAWESNRSSSAVDAFESFFLKSDSKLTPTAKNLTDADILQLVHKSR